MIYKAITLATIATFWVTVFPPVYVLPFGIHDYVQSMVNVIRALADTAPWLLTVLNVIVIGMVVSMAIWTFDKMLFIIQLVKG